MRVHQTMNCYSWLSEFPGYARSKVLLMPSDTRLSQGLVFGAQRGLCTAGAGTQEYQMCPASLVVDTGWTMCASLCLGIPGSVGDQPTPEDFWLGLGFLLVGAGGGLQVAWHA